jgi:hypothetical protein
MPFYDFPSIALRRARHSAIRADAAGSTPPTLTKLNGDSLRICSMRAIPGLTGIVGSVAEPPLD